MAAEAPPAGGSATNYPDVPATHCYADSLEPPPEPICDLVGVLAIPDSPVHVSIWNFKWFGEVDSDIRCGAYVPLRL